MIFCPDSAVTMHCIAFHSIVSYPIPFYPIHLPFRQKENHTYTTLYSTPFYHNIAITRPKTANPNGSPPIFIPAAAAFDATPEGRLLPDTPPSAAVLLAVRLPVVTVALLAPPFTASVVAVTLEKGVMEAAALEKTVVGAAPEATMMEAETLVMISNWPE